MKRILSLAAVLVSVLFLAPNAAFAAKQVSSKPLPAPVELTGYDLSYPQCGVRKLPTGQYFGIVGVNGGTAATTNPCLAAQLSWANKSVTGSNQPRVQLYVNTANPAGDSSYNWASWPANNTDKTGFTTADPYGTCTGLNDTACSWQYGWNRSVEAYNDRFVPAAKTANIDSSAKYVWWLDVETTNSWQTGSAGALARNAATLEGMTAYYEAQGGSVGLYSTAVQWGSIAGSSVSSSSNLNGLPNWRPSGSSLANAKANCSVTPLTAGGSITLTQYVSGGLDNDHSCI